MASKNSLALARGLLNAAFSGATANVEEGQRIKSSESTEYTILDDDATLLLVDNLTHGEGDDADEEIVLTEAFKNDSCFSTAVSKFSVCTDSTFAHNVSTILRKEYGFSLIPKEYWFTSERGEKEDMYRPKNGLSCEWCDRSVFSFCDNRFENSVVLYSKVQLAELIARHTTTSRSLPGFAGNVLVTPSTWIIRNGKFCTLLPPEHLLNTGSTMRPEQVDSNSSGEQTDQGLHNNIYFLKDDEADYGTGVFPMPSLNACLQHAQKLENIKKHYVVQTHVPNVLLTRDGRKFTVRVYALISSPPGPDRKLDIFVYKNGYFAAAKEKWEATSISPDSQISTNRDLSLGRLAEWEYYEALFPKLCQSTSKVLYAAATEFIVQRKRTFELFGLDFMISKGEDGVMTPYLLEVNSGPVTKEDDFPMLRGLVKIAIIGVDDARPSPDNYDADDLEKSVNDWKLVKTLRAYWAMGGEIEVDVEE